MKRRRSKLFVSLAAFCLTVAFLFQAAADARTDYLVNMLKNGVSYRVKVQAATTLGKIRAVDAIPALLEALDDSNELVVIAATVALGRIGDSSAIEPIKKAALKSSSEAAKSQFEKTLRILTALKTGGISDAAPNKPRFYIRVDSMGNSSKVQRDELKDLMKKAVLERLRKEPDVIVQEEKKTNEEVRKILKEKKLEGYILTGALLKLERVDNQILIKVNVNVFTNPDYNLGMMPSRMASFPLEEPVDEQSEKAVQERAVRITAASLAGAIVEVLRNLEQ